MSHPDRIPFERDERETLFMPLGKTELSPLWFSKCVMLAHEKPNALITLEILHDIEHDCDGNFPIHSNLAYFWQEDGALWMGHIYSYDHEMSYYTAFDQPIARWLWDAAACKWFKYKPSTYAGFQVRITRLEE